MDNNINYWMFRVSNKWGYRTRVCLDEGFVCCGWNIGLSNKEPSEILKNHPWASRMAIKFTYIKENDVIIMPVPGGVAIGRAKDKVFRADLDWQDTLNIEWLTHYYDRKNLSSNLQSSLKYRGTFLSLNRYAPEFEQLISEDFISKSASHAKTKQNLAEQQLDSISKHLSSRSLNFQDREFEDFVMHLFELNYPGITGHKNNQRQEANDGKDLTMGIDFDDFDLNIKFNIQVKQHGGHASHNALTQISKSDDENHYVKNVVITTANLDDDIRAQAKDMKIILFGPRELAEMIIDNFENIDHEYQAKLNLFTSIKTLSEISGK